MERAHIDEERNRVERIERGCGRRRHSDCCVREWLGGCQERPRDGSLNLRALHT